MSQTTPRPAAHAEPHASRQDRQQATCAAVILFAVFSCAGWLYETLDNVLTFGGLYLRASLVLPWCPIYGVGGLVVVGVLEPARRKLAGRVPKWAQVMLMALAIYVLTALIELAGSYVCEALMGYVPWDYSQAWLNLDGRIAPAYTLRFVVLGLVALYVVRPHVMRLTTTHRRGATIVAVIIVCLFTLDVAGEALGLWTHMKDALVPYGIRHW